VYQTRARPLSGKVVIDWNEVSALVAASGLVWGAMTYVQKSNRERAQRRGELVREYTRELSSDPALVQLFTDIDYGRLRFRRSQEWLGAAPEQNLVRMLDLFNSLGLKWKHKAIRLEDVIGTTLGYAIVRAWQDRAVSAYLEHVTRWDELQRGTGYPFQFFKDLANALLADSLYARLRPAATSGPAHPGAGRFPRRFGTKPRVGMRRQRLPWLEKRPS